VGISLGGSENLIAGSIALIKDIEQERLKSSYVGNSIDKECESEEDEVDPDTSTIDRLCGDLTEEVMDVVMWALMEYLLTYPSRWQKIKSLRNSLIGRRL